MLTGISVLQVLIQNGELLTGGLCKKTLGASGGSLIHVIMMEHGPEAARAFLSQCQYLTNHWLLQHGMSIGIGDTVADYATMQAINETINKVRAADASTADFPVVLSCYHTACIRWVWHAQTFECCLASLDSSQLICAEGCCCLLL